MTKALSLIATIILISLIVLVLRSSPDSGAAPTTPTTEESVADTATDISTASRPSTPTTARQATDTTSADDVPSASDLEARFVLTEVSFGDNGYVAIANVGGAVASLQGHALCQRPNYFVLPPIELAPFDVVWVAIGDGEAITNPSVVEIVAANRQLGRAEASGGEMALYRSAEFGNAGEMLSYVEWGTADHGRSSIAVEAGLWEAGAFVEIPDDAFGVATVVAAPAGPGDWTAQIGG